MAKLNELFPSKYATAADLDGDERRAIADIAVEKMARRRCQARLVLSADRQRPMPLNKTNANIIAKAYGTDTDGWIGKTITLLRSTTEFQSEIVACIRVKIPDAQSAARPASKNLNSLNHDFDDEIPF